MRVGIFTDFPSPAVQSGPAIHTRFLAEGLRNRGHSVVLMGPDTGQLAPMDSSETHLYRAAGYPTHPKIRIPMPAPVRSLANPPKLDVIHGQTNTYMVHYAGWIRRMWQVPVLNTHTVHLPKHSHAVLSDWLYSKQWIREQVERSAHSIEEKFARLYNQGDCLIVQNRYFIDYWRERGVTVPIEIVCRPVDPAKFSKQPGEDPFPEQFSTGGRLLCVCRHDREKRLEHLITIFSERIAPRNADATLTLVGNGHHHANLKRFAAMSPYADRIHLPGEALHDDIVDWYAHANVFVYTSLSETFGNVVNEALWTGLPVVALDDQMGVAHQVQTDSNGFLITPGRTDTDEAFAAACSVLLRDRGMQRMMGEKAATLAHQTAHPDNVFARFEAIYAEAGERCRREIQVPLSQRSKLTQYRTLAASMAAWGWWNGLLLGLAHAATRLGGKQRRYEPLDPSEAPSPAAVEPTADSAGWAEQPTG